MRRAMALLALSTMLLSGTLGSSILGIKAEAAERSSIEYLPIEIDGNADDWEIFKNMNGMPDCFETFKAFKTDDTLYVSFSLKEKPAAVPDWYIGINSDGDAGTGHLDYAGADYAVLDDKKLYSNHDTPEDEWSWEDAPAGAMESFYSADGSFAEFAFDLETIGDSEDLNLFVLDGTWTYVFSGTPAVGTYADAVSTGDEDEEDEPVAPVSDSVITLDGKDDDWRDFRSVLSETDGAFDRIAGFVDDEYVYIHFAVNSVSDWCTLHVFLDIDEDDNTGYTLIEGSSIYKSVSGEWPDTNIGAASVAKSSDGSMQEVRIKKSYISDEEFSEVGFRIALLNDSWADVHTYPAGSYVKAKYIDDVKIVSQQPFISDFAIHTDFIKALTPEAMKDGVIASFTANGGDSEHYSYALAYNNKLGKDNGRFTIEGDKLIVNDAKLAPGLYNIYVRVNSGDRSDKKAFEVEVHAPEDVAITEDIFNGHNGEWFAVPYKAANAIPNLTEIRTVADSENLNIEVMAKSVSSNLRIYVSDGKTAGADMTATWNGASSMGYMIDALGNFYKYQDGNFVKTDKNIAFALAANGVEMSIPVSYFDANADTFLVGADDGAGAVLPNEGNDLLSCMTPNKGTPISITADGDPSDWTDEYKIGEGSGSLGDLWAVRTKDYLYAMTFVTVDDSEKDTEYSYSTNLYIDSDNNAETGYGYKEIYTKAGADFLLQDWMTNNVEMTYRTGNGDGFGFSHAAGDCGNNLSDYKITKETSTPGVYCIEYKIPIEKMETTLGLMVDDMSISVQRDSTVRTAFPGVTKAIGMTGTYYSLVPKFGTKFAGTIDGNLSEWSSVPTVAVNTATENVYNMYTTKSQYKLYAMVTSDNNDLDTTTRFVISSADNTGFEYFGYENVDYVIKDGNLYPVKGVNELGQKIKAVDITYNTDAVELRLYREDLNSENVKIAALACNKAVCVPAGKYVNVSSEFEMYYDSDYVYPYENFEVYNNPYKGWAAWANAKLADVEKIAYDHNLAFFPVTWEDVEAKKGKYDWSYVNEKYQLKYWKENGTRINFRFVMDTPEVLTGPMKDTTYGYYVDEDFMRNHNLIGNDGKVSEQAIKNLFATGNFRADLPAWLVAELCNETLEGKTENAGTFYNWPDPDTLGGASFSPNYYSDLLLNYHNEIIKAFAERFDDPSITGFVQVGSLGHWGEFHTWPEAESFSEYNFGSGDFPDPTRAGEYALTYVNNFKNIKIGLRYPYPVAAENGFGLFNDVFGAEEGSESFIGAIKNGNVVNITNPGPTDTERSKMPDFWKTNYSGGEFSNGNVKLWVNNDAIMRSISYLTDSHTSWLGPCSPCDLQDGDFDAYRYEGNIKYLQRLMGYRFSVEKVNYVPSVDPGKTLSLSIDWRNLGVAPFYYNWPMEVSLVDTDGKVVASKVQDVNITNWLPDTEIRTDVDFEVPSKIKKGRYKLSVALLDPSTNEPAVHLAMEGGDDNLRYGLYYINVGSKKLVDATTEDTIFYGISGDLLCGSPMNCADESEGGSSEETSSDINVYAEDTTTTSETETTTETTTEETTTEETTEEISVALSSGENTSDFDIELPDGLSGNVYASVPMNNTAMSSESSTLFLLDENHTEGSVSFVAGTSGNMRLRAIPNGDDGIKVSTGDSLIITYVADETINLQGVSVQACFDSKTSYDSVDFVTINDNSGCAVMDIPASADGKTVYALRIKGNNYPEGSKIAITGIYFVKNLVAEQSEPEKPAVDELIGTSFQKGSISGKISGYAKMKNDTTGIKAESGCLNFAADQTPGTLKFTSNGSSSVRNRAYINDGLGTVINKGDMFYMEFDADEDISGMTLEALYDDPEGWNSVGFLTMSDNGGYMMAAVPGDAVGQTLKALRIKGNGYPEGASITFKKLYILTDVKDNAAIEYNYPISEKVGGVTVTYYNDIFSRGVSWRTINEPATDSVLQYIDAKDVATDIGHIDWSNTELVKTIEDNFDEELINTSASADKYYCHKAHIVNIPDKTTYYYRVGSETSGYSKVGCMKIDSELNEFQFIHVTDPQATSLSEYQQYAALLKAAYAKTRENDYALAGTFNTGDITNENHDGRVYIDEYNMSQDLDADDLMNSVFIPVAGNHDVTEDVFYKMYDIDFANYCTDGKHNNHRTGGCYSLQIGNVFVIGTNSNESGNLTGGGGEYDSKASYIEQYTWIENQLKEASKLRDEGKVDWIIYLTHAGMMSVGYHTMDGGSVALRNNICPLLAKYEADLILQGHDHAYTRTVPYYYGKNGIGESFSGYESNNRETFKGYGDLVYDNPYTEAVETEEDGGRFWNIEPEGTHYITINFAGTKSLDISKDNAESSYKMPDECIMDGIATSPVNGIECGLKYAKQFYGIITVSGDTLTYDTYEFSGSKSSLFDTFTVIKDGNHGPDLGKKDIDFTGVYAEDKEYDGKSIKIDYEDILAISPDTKEVETEFTDYDKITFSVTGTLANGKEYTASNKLPTEIGNYTLHVIVGEDSAFFKGETEIAMVITPATPKAKPDFNKYVGGLTKELLNSGIDYEEGDTPSTPSEGEAGSSSDNTGSTTNSDTNASEKVSQNIIEKGKEVLNNIGIIRDNRTAQRADIIENSVVVKNDNTDETLEEPKLQTEETVTELPDEKVEVIYDMLIPLAKNEEIEMQVNETVSELVEKIISNSEDIGNAVSEETYEKIKAALAEGKGITAMVTIKAVDETVIAKEDKLLFEKVISEQKNENLEIACYLDLSIMLMTTDGEELGTYDELTGMVTFTIEVPESIGLSEGKEYVIIRTHNGETSILPVIENEDGTISFSVDKFSSYALAMRDIEKSSTALVVIIASVAALAVVFAGFMVIRKRKSAVE